MAYRDELEQEQDQSTTDVFGAETEQIQQPTNEQASQTATDISGTSAMVGSSSATPSQKSTPSSGSFTNIRKFLDANKGAGQEIADTGVQKTEEKSQEIGKAVEQSKQEYMDKVSQAQNETSNLQSFGQSAIQQAGRAPVDTQQFQNLMAGEKFTDIGNADYSQAGQDVEQFQQGAEESEKASGRFKLLRDFFQQPDRRYTQGSQLLDASLLQQSPDAKQQLVSKVQDEAAQRMADYQAAQDSTQAAQSEVLSGRDALLNLLGSELSGARTTMQDQVSGRASTEYDKRVLAQQQLQNAINTGQFGNLDRDLAANMGLNMSNINTDIDPYDLAQVRDLANQIATQKLLDQGNLSNYITGLDAPVSQSDIMAYITSPEEKSRIQALANLAGEQDYSYVPETINPVLQSGLYGLNVNQADLAAANSDLLRQAEATMRETSGIRGQDDRVVAALLYDRLVNNRNISDRRYSNADLNRLAHLAGEPEVFDNFDEDIQGLIDSGQLGFPLL